jgi:hypothetical protein
MIHDPDDAIRAADRLAAKVDDLRSELQSLRQFGKRNRHFIWGLAISLVLDVCLSIAIAVLAVTATEASHQASEATSLSNRTRDTQLVTCQAGNESRAAQVQLWTYVLDLAAQNPNPPPQQAQRLAQFRTYLSTTFAPRDCTAANPTAATPTAVPPAPSTTPTR